MDGDEDVRPHGVAAGDSHSPAQGHVVVAAAHQLGGHARHAIKVLLRRLGDGEHHALLVHAAGADGAGIFAAMAGVQRHHGQPLAGRRRHRFAPRRRRIPIAFGIQIDHQPMAVGRCWRQGEVLGAGRAVQVQHHAQVALAAAGVAHALDHAAVELGVGKIGRGGVLQIDHHPIRPPHGEHLVGGLGAGIQHHAGGVRRVVQANAVDLVGGQRRQRQHERGNGQQPRDRAPQVAAGFNDGLRQRHVGPSQPRSNAR